MMNLLTIEDISKSYSEKTLLDKISLGINDGDKIGIIGLNGAGKSTLLKIIGGAEEPDAGKRIVGSDVKVEYLPQNPVFYENATVLEQVFRGTSSVMRLLREYENALESLNLDPNNESAQKKILELNHKMDAAGAWQLESEAKTVLTKLGIKDFNARVEELSGGQRKRIALASALITPSDLLILDEPTNHLDNYTVDWLEQFLNKRKGALIMITHDRYFLDRVANRIIELDMGNLYAYTGNYSVYLEKKLEREELDQANERKRQSILRKELAWIRRGAKARTTKQKARIDRFEKLNEDGIDIKNDKLEITAAASRLGKKVIEIENIDKSFDSRKLIENFSYIVIRNDRVGIIGPNGSGKSTLMNIIAGKLSSDNGSLSYGETVKIAYFSQENVDMDDRLRVIDYIREEAEYVAAPDGTLISASKMLERFLFTGSMQYTPLSKLSGGEKRRLYLLRILMSAPNVLLLDEPTNDIDIQTLTILEDYIDDFNGAVMAVSHDRYFLDRIADKIFSFEGNGVIIQHTGNYSDYVEFKESNPIIENIPNASENKKSNNVDKKKETVDKKDKPIKFTFKEKKEFDEIDGNIEKTENELTNINKSIEKCSSDYEKLQELLKKKEELEDRLECLMERWMYLNEIAENMK